MGRILSLVAVVLTAACSNFLAPVDPAEEPFIRGVITAHDSEWGILVEAQPLEASTVEAAWVRSDKNTTVHRAGAGGVVWESLSEGQSVSVWIKGAVMESLPVKVVAASVVVE